MEIGVGLDGGLGLSLEQQRELSREAARLGYTSIWTNEGAGEDCVLNCTIRWEASAEVVPGGLTTGIAVSPVGLRTPMGFALSAGTLSKHSGGRFILGIGTGGSYQPAYRNTWGIQETSSLRLMRDYITAIKGLVNGEAIMHEGKSFAYHGARLAIDPPPQTPVYLAALGPEMLRLGGEIADGISLNWCTADMIAWSRERVDEGEAKAGRAQGTVKLSEYIRICVDDDEAVARKAYTRAVMGYAIGPGPDAKGRPQGYRAHFERMGFAVDLAAIDIMRAKNAPQQEVVDAFPDDLLKAVGYYGKAEGAAAHFRRLAEGLDIAIVRVVAARPGEASIRAVMEACQPAVVPA